jgi:hypothetical protein
MKWCTGGTVFSFNRDITVPHLPRLAFGYLRNLQKVPFSTPWRLVYWNLKIRERGSARVSPGDKN